MRRSPSFNSEVFATNFSGIRSTAFPWGFFGAGLRGENRSSLQNGRHFRPVLGPEFALFQLRKQQAAGAGQGCSGRRAPCCQPRVFALICGATSPKTDDSLGRDFSEETEAMSEPRITGLRSVELGVHDLQKSAEFYRKVWALEDVSGEGDTLHLRGTSRDHHVLTLRERPRAGLLGVHFSVADRATADALHAKAVAMGMKVAGAPGALEKSAGGGYGFHVSTPEGHPIVISADVADHARRSEAR